MVLFTKFYIRNAKANLFPVFDVANSKFIYKYINLLYYSRPFPI